MHALFLTRYCRQGGSSRWMVYEYLEFYRQAGIRCTVAPLFDERYFTFQLLHRPKGLADILRHGSYYAGIVLERLRRVLTAGRYDLVVFEKELIPYLGYGLEALLHRLQARTVVLYDDATYIYYRDHPARWVRWLTRDKIRRVMASAAHVVVWNETLAAYARQFNPNVSVVNTGVDLRRYRVKDYAAPPAAGRPFVIGWIGTPNGFRYIEGIEPAFAELARTHAVELRVISSRAYHSPHVPVVNRPWSEATEIDDLLALDAGIMPLPDDEWTRGKSGAKAVQYMATGVPAVCSPVGMVTDLVQHGVNGFLARDAHEWAAALARLAGEPALRRTVGLAGRGTVETTYSIQAVAPRLIAVLKQAGRR